jgi:hypothetical protein
MFRRITTSAAAALAAAAIFAPGAAAYPGPDGYDAMYCTASGIRLDVTNYFSGTGQEFHGDVDDNSSSNSVKRVQYSSSLATFTASWTSLSDWYIYRASKTEAPRFTLYTTNGAYCAVTMNG